MILFGAIEPPADLSLWVGSLVLAALVPELIRRLLSRGDASELQRVKAEAEWKAEVRASLARLLEMKTDLVRLEGQVTALTGRVTAAEERQDEQGNQHRADVRELRAEFEKKS